MKNSNQYQEELQKCPSHNELSNAVVDNQYAALQIPEIGDKMTIKMIREQILTHVTMANPRDRVAAKEAKITLKKFRN